MFTINQNLIDDFADKINEKEKKSNKVTSLSSSSTDTQYPSAKIVYDSLNNLHTSNIKIAGEPLTNIWTGATIPSQAQLNTFINNHIGEIDARLQKEEIVYGSIYKTDSSRVYISGTYNKVCDSVGSQHPFLNEMILFKLPNDLNSSSTKSIRIKVIYYTTSYASSQNFFELPVKYNNAEITENTFVSNTIILLKLNSMNNGFDIVGVFSPNSTGSYTDLTDKPTIPSKTSDLTNDSGFLTSHQSLSGYLQTSDVKDNLTSTDTNKPLSAKQGKELKTLVDNKIDKGNIQGGVNILGQWQGEKKDGGNCSMPTRTYSVFHENPIDVIDNQSVSDTSDYSGMKYMIKASVFQPTDVFTFSFWAKGDANNTNNTIRAYFSNGMNVRRLYSNSDVDYGESESSSNDGNTLFNLTNEWQLFTVTYQIKEGGTNQSSKYPSIRVYGGCKCSVSSAKLERGFNATDYSPCDEIPINLNYNIDYNDYKNDGNYFVWGSQQTGNTNKPPSDTQGGLLTVKSIPNGCIQILYNYFLASPKVYYRIYHASQGWRNWQTLSVDGHTHNSTDIKSVKISSGDNLNDYIATGFYYNPSNTEAQNITNIPESGKAFFLLVEDWGTYNYTKQTITHYGTGKTYTRIRNSGNWGAWKKLINVDDASSSKGLADDPYNGLVGTSTKYAREDHAHGKLYHWSTGGVSTATYVDLLEFTMTTSWQDIPISLVLGKRARDRPYYVNIRFSNTNITSSTYTVDSFKVWGGDETALLLYLRKVEDNKYRLCAYKAANDVYYINDIVNFNTGITITKIASADGNYGTTAPTGSAPNLYSLTKVDDLPKGIIQGGKNIISTLPVTYNNSGVSITTDGETFHNETVYKSLLSEVSDTSKYSDVGFVIPYENFTYGDVFTLSFWAKGTSGKEIKAYFYGDSGYINNKRIRSNSTIDNTEGSYNDGLTKFILTNEWQHFYVTYKLNTTGTATANKKLAIRTFGGTDCSVACVQLERGEIATDYERPPLTQFSGLVSTACYVNLLQFEMTESYQDNPINIEISYKGRERPTQLQIRFSNTNLSASTNNVYTVSIFKSTQDQMTYYLRKVADNKYMLIANKGANAWYNIHKIWNSNTGVKISIANTSYGTSAPTGSAPNLYVSSYAGVMDTELTWNGGSTSNSVSPLTMAMGDDFSANRLAYFPSTRMSVEYSTDGGSTWSNYSSIGAENKQRMTVLAPLTVTAYLGNNSSADRTKNRLRITFDCGDIGSDSVLYMITRKLAMYTGTNNSTGFTCQVQTQTYAQYNTNVNTFSNVGSAITLGGNAGWNTRPLNITLGGFASQTSSTSTRIKALRLLFVQTGGTGNATVKGIRLYGETAYVTPSKYAQNGHIYATDVNQNATFPSKIIKDGGTSSQFLMANGDVQNKITSWSNTPSDSNIASEKLVKDSLDLKSDNTHTHIIDPNTLFDFYNADNWKTLKGESPTITTNTIQANSVSQHILKKEFLKSKHYTLTFDYNTPTFRTGIYLFGDENLNKKFGVVTDITNTFVEEYDEYGNTTTLYTGTKNYLTEGLHNIKVIRDEDNATIYIDGELFYTFTDIGFCTNIVGLQKWGYGSASMSDFLMVGELGEPILCFIDNILGHMINNWEDYE